MAVSARDASGFARGRVLGGQANSLSSGLAGAIDRVYNTAQANSAASAAQAQELRNWQQEQTQKQMDFNAAEAQKNRDWQQYMSNTAHQREVADLKAAGLNPILSAMGGNGASVTSGATASASAPSGAKGDVDTSANAAIINLLGSFLQAQTSLENQRLNAQNNMAIAEKNNASSQLIAQINGMFGNERAHISGSYGVRQAQTSANAVMTAAQIAAAASMSNARTSALASMRNTELTQQTHRQISAANRRLQRELQENQQYYDSNHPTSPMGMAKYLGDLVTEMLGSLNGMDVSWRDYGVNK